MAWYCEPSSHLQLYFHCWASSVLGYAEPGSCHMASVRLYMRFHLPHRCYRSRARRFVPLESIKYTIVFVLFSNCTKCFRNFTIQGYLEQGLMVTEAAKLRVHYLRSIDFRLDVRIISIQVKQCCTAMVTILICLGV